jgi:putative glycosyltransferase (TIGR04372 family)
MIIDRIFHKINSSKNHPYFYLSPYVYAFGNCAEEIHAGLIKAKYSKKKLVILYPFDIPFIFKYKLTNRALFNIKSDFIVDQGKYVTILSRSLMTFIYMPLRVVGLLLRKFSRFNLLDSYHFPRIGIRDVYVPENSIKKFSLESVREINWSEKISKKINFTISLNGNTCNGNEQQKLGIPKNSWFVCLHVRGSGYRGDKGRKDYRNPNILNYIPAIKKITSKGGWVVRMGDHTMKPLPSMKNVIDYPFTKYKNEFMDLCLIQNCRFFIGGQSGLQAFAVLAFKNILLVNMPDWCLVSTLRNDRGILQRLYSTRDNRFLSIRELLTVDLKSKNFHISNCHEDKNYIVTENSAEEISKAVVEYMDFLNNDDLSLTSKQKEFIECRKAQGNRVCENNRISSPETHNDEDEVIKRYKAAALLEWNQGTLCAGFLEDNW